MRNMLPDARDQYHPDTLVAATVALRIELIALVVALIMPIVDGITRIVENWSNGSRIERIEGPRPVFSGSPTSTAPQPFSHDVSEQNFDQSRAPMRARHRSA